MGRFKMRGGSFLPYIGLPDNLVGGIVLTVFLLLFLTGIIAVIGLPLGWYNKTPSAPSAPPKDSVYTDTLAISLTSPQPKNCPSTKVGCMPTGVTMTATPTSTGFKNGSYNLVWKAQGFYLDNQAAFQKTGTSSFTKTNGTTFDIDIGRAITGVAGTVYLKAVDGSTNGPMASFNYQSPASTRH